jgi:hypothetical protein
MEELHGARRGTLQMDEQVGVDTQAESVLDMHRRQDLAGLLVVAVGGVQNSQTVRGAGHVVVPEHRPGSTV